MSAAGCDPMLTKLEIEDLRKSAGTADEVGCPPEMAVSEPGGSAAVSAKMERAQSGVRDGLIGGQ